ncbi:MULTISPECIES: helix-turn-helix transcriptional regulator [unclassified Streptomyces]|uniref:helix-turn-helix domain-containing protein n=1 Tax=unclassified Streptomyces TaxID=2593676 RepID=UPI0033D7A768
MHQDPLADWIIETRRAIGDRVREEREYANFTQERLALTTGIPRLTVQRIESGATDARLSWLLRIARCLDIPLSRLLGD